MKNLKFSLLCGAVALCAMFLVVACYPAKQAVNSLEVAKCHIQDYDIYDINEKSYIIPFNLVDGSDGECELYAELLDYPAYTNRIIAEANDAVIVAAIKVCLMKNVEVNNVNVAFIIEAAILFDMDL